jgi:NCAIR mutase (PurE)-related protein
MTDPRLKAIIDAVVAGTLTPADAEARLAAAMRDLPFEDLGYARVDHHRVVRQGFPEVVFGQGKTPEQIAGIAERIVARGHTLLVTRANDAAFAAVSAAIPAAEWHAVPRCIVWRGAPPDPGHGTVLIAAAGTSDLPVAEEAALTAELMGNHVDRLFDVGVAGLHRLLHARDRVDAARVVIVVAGMEGALPSVIGGLTASPVIAVPTSVGYGASFGGLSALLGMLNSCAAGVAVVNIDNGFGAAAMASKINHL